MYWITGALGILLAVAPFLFGYSSNLPAVLTSLLVGGTTVIVSWIEKIKNDTEQWEYMTVSVLGLLTIAAPFIFNFRSVTTATWTAVITGILLAMFAGYKLMGEQWKKT